MIHRRDQKAASTARRVKNQLLFRGIEHRYGHAANISGGEEFAPVAAKVRTNDSS